MLTDAQFGASHGPAALEPLCHWAGEVRVRILETLVDQGPAGRLTPELEEELGCRRLITIRVSYPIASASASASASAQCSECFGSA